METYPEMDAAIVGFLRLRKDAMSHYAAQRIEDLEAEIQGLRCQIDSLEWRFDEALNTRERDHE